MTQENICFGMNDNIFSKDILTHIYHYQIFDIALLVMWLIKVINNDYIKYLTKISMYPNDL